MIRRFIYTYKISQQSVSGLLAYANGEFSFVLKDKTAFSWGYNQYGKLGDNTSTNRCTPVSILGAKKTFCKIILGSYHAMTIDKNGQVWTWGYNNYGQLGDNSVTSRRTPVSILGAKKTFCQIAGGFWHSGSIDKSGQVWCWGNNGYGGQLGNNSATQQCTPVSVHGAKKTFCQIFMGQYHSIAIDHVGQTWTWGYNNYGQLGINSTSNSCTPVSILGAKKKFCQITAGFYHIIGIDKKGQVWAWGFNQQGQLGDNSVTSRLTPVSILGAKKTFCQISSGYHTSMAIDKNGQVWTWGYNNYGQLGDNSVTNKYTPVSILGTKKTFCQIFAGWYHGLGVDNAGKVWTWGYNSYGHLGDYTSVSRKTPVRVCTL